MCVHRTNISALDESFCASSPLRLPRCEVPSLFAPNNLNSHATTRRRYPTLHYAIVARPLPSPPPLKSLLFPFVAPLHPSRHAVRPPSLTLPLQNMSEIQSRPAASRGRGSARGGRGAFRPSRGGAARNAGHSNGDTHDNIDDQSELGQLKKRYGSKLATLAEMFTELNAEDILFELQENSGDLEITAAKISEGQSSAALLSFLSYRSRRRCLSFSFLCSFVLPTPLPRAPAPPLSGPVYRLYSFDVLSARKIKLTLVQLGSTAKWGEVRKKNKDRSRSKVKEPATSASNNDSFQSPRPARSGRAPFDGSRGGRGRGGLETRGGRGGRSRGGAAANGVSRGQAKDRSNDTLHSWGETTTASNVEDPWGTSVKTDGDPWETPETVEKPVAVKPVATPATRGSWASLLKPAVPPPVPVQSKAAQPAPEGMSSAAQEAEPVAETPDEPELVTEIEESAQPEVTVTEQPDAEPAVEGPLEELTEENVERIEDAAPPAPTETAASTVAASALQDNTSTSPVVQVAIPQNAAKHTPIPKGTPGRTFRRVLDQQEGVVMPGNHAEVNRTALQFGSMGLSGDLDDDEEAENSQPIAQPAQPSPIVQPIASLPPTGPSQFPLSQVPESIPTPRQAPGLSSQPQGIPQASVQPPLAPQSMTQHQVHPQLAAQYNRYGVPEQQQPQTKPFDSFGHMQQQSAHQQPPTQPQQPQAQHPQSQPQNYAQYMQPQQQPSHIGIGVSSAPEQQQHYNYYTDRSQPPGFGLYGNSAYMQTQQAHAQQEAGASQQRASSGLSGAAEPSAQVPASVSVPGQVQQPTSRYGAPAGDHGSGHATPSPAPPVSQPHQQTMGQQTYPMQFHPYYNQYMHQVSNLPPLCLWRVN
jgi:hypothetical protein